VNHRFGSYKAIDAIIGSFRIYLDLFSLAG